MKLRMKKMPRPLALRRFSGASGSGKLLGLETVTVVANSDEEFGRRVRRSHREVQSTSFDVSKRLPCLMALMTDSLTATPTQCWASSSNPSIRPS